MSDGYDALRTGAAWLDLSARGRIRVTGRDRVRLLHNVTTNDVKKLAAGEGCYAFLLSPQGRIQADLHLFCREDHFLIDTEPELREKVPSLIRRYIVADQVELEDVSDATACLGVEGPRAAELLSSLGAPSAGADFARVSTTGQPGFRIFAPAAGRDELVRSLEAAGARAATSQDARVVRIEQGRPRYGEDIFETSLVQETGQLHAVNFQKGCYLGQEIVERVRARGHVNRKLVRLEIDTSEPPAAGARLMAEDQEAGEITSAAYSPAAGKVIALAYARVPFDQPGSALRVEGAAAVVT
jgi:aminomethyltransferase